MNRFSPVHKNIVKIGILAGTGLNNTLFVNNPIKKPISTPYGDPSDILTEGFISEVPCVLLSRHGMHHDISPSNINYRANIWALKSAGCSHVIALTSCGGLQHETKPGDFVILDQFFDNTKGRIQTFYDGQPNSPKGVLHIPMNDPFCKETCKILYDAVSLLKGNVHKTGSVVTIEGPRFSSKFESQYWHNMGASVINMTTVPEVILAKELGLCYAALAMVTDYDSWRDVDDSVNVKKVVDIVKDNAKFVKDVIIAVVELIGKGNWDDILHRNKRLIEEALV